MSHIDFRGKGYLKRRLVQFDYQLGQLLLVCLGALLVGCLELVAPSFFNYPYFYWGGFEALTHFWPLFLYVITVNFLVGRYAPGWIDPRYRSEILLADLVTANLAGLWEELGYRWVYICFAMVGITSFNLLLSSGVGWVIVIIGGIVALVGIYERDWLPALISLAISAVALFYALYADPVYWFYQLFVLVVYYTTFTLMEPVLYGSHPELLVFGAVLANSWFRDGHKYQGIFGLVNSWYGGMILLYAALQYGLLTAIVVHGLYNTCIVVSDHYYRRG